MSIKRRELTTDDLLRQTEEPHRKKQRVAENLRDTGRVDWEAGDNSGISDEGSEDTNDIQGSEEAETTELEDEKEGNDSEDSQVDSDKSEGEERVPFSDTGGILLGKKLSLGNIINHTTQKPAATNAQTASFASFGIATPLLAALNSMSIKAPTSVQAACIPPLLQGIEMLSIKGFYVLMMFKEGTVLATQKLGLERQWPLPYLSCNSCLWTPLAYTLWS